MADPINHFFVRQVENQQPTTMKTLLLTTLLLVGSSHLSHANDSYLPKGGSPQTFSSHRTISMEKETIKIQVLEKTVKADCWFVFKNNGPAANVRMGFPDDAGSSEQDGGKSGFIHFNSYVNGKWTPAQSVRQNGENWKVKTVAFPANSTTIVRDVYVTPIGAAAISMELSVRMAAYTLHTGASWKGNIGQSVVEFTFAYAPRPKLLSDKWSILKWTPASFSGGNVFYQGPSKSTVSGKTLRFVRTNWRPTEEDDIRLYFLPTAKKATIAKASSAQAMQNFIKAIKNKDKTAMSGMVSKTNGFDYYNSIFQPSRFGSHTSYTGLGDWYSFFFTAKKLGDDGGDTLFDMVRKSGGKSWQRVGDNKYRLSGQQYQLSVQWRQENSKWVIQRIEYPMS